MWAVQRAFGECGWVPSSRRRPPPPRLNCPPFLFCLSPPPRVALHQISIGSKMVAPHLDFTTTTSFVNSTSKALAAGARSHSILRGTLGFRSGRVPAGWLEERADEGARRLFPCLSSLTCLQRLEHQSAALVVSLIWLLLASRPPGAAAAGSCWRAGSSVVAALLPGSSYRRLILSDMPQSAPVSSRGRGAL